MSLVLVSEWFMTEQQNTDIIRTSGSVLGEQKITASVAKNLLTEGTCWPLELQGMITSFSSKRALYTLCTHVTPSTLLGKKTTNEDKIKIPKFCG